MAVLKTPLIILLMNCLSHIQIWVEVCFRSGKRTSTFFDIVIQTLNHLDVLEMGFIVTGLNFLCVFNLAVAIGPGEVSLLGYLFEVLDLPDVEVCPLLESLNVHCQDNVEVRDGAGHLSNLLEDNVVILGYQDD